MSEPIIRAEALTKRYGSALAVDGLDLTIEAGEVFGLLGPNGAGKTTTILMLLGLTEPTSGRAVVAGFDPLRQPLEVKRRVGYMPDSVGFYDHLSGVANLRYSAALCGLKPADADARIDAALKRVRLEAAGGRAGARLFARHAPAPGDRRDPDEGRRDRHPRRADRRSRSAIDARVPRADPFAEAGGHDDPAVVAHARTRPIDLRPRRAVPSRPHRPDGPGRRSAQRRARRLARDPRRGARRWAGRARSAASPASRG